VIAGLPAFSDPVAYTPHLARGVRPRLRPGL